MGGGYKAPRDGMEQIAGRFLDQSERLRELERPTGTSIGSLLQQVQQTLANIVSQVNTIATNWMAANAYTKAQVDAKVASPGTIAPSDVNASGNVVAGGQVTSTQPLKSIGSFNYQVTTGYKAAWINNDGQVGFSPSTREVKKDLEPFPADLTSAFLNLTPYLGRYTWDDETEPLKVFLIAEDAQAAGFGPDVVPLDEDGNPVAINYSQMVVPLLAIVKQQQAQIDTMAKRIEALER